MYFPKILLSTFLLIFISTGNLFSQYVAHITGSASVQPGATEYYEVSWDHAPHPYSNITFTVTGGTIVAQNINPTIQPNYCTVEWDNTPGTGSVYVYEDLYQMEDNLSVTVGTSSTQIDCTPMNLNGCNYIFNNNFTSANFNPSDGNDVADPFNRLKVPNWLSSNGTPNIYYSTQTIANPFFIPTPPSPATGYARMASQLNFSSVISEGIVQKIPDLSIGNKYSFSFYKSNYDYGNGFIDPVDNYYIVLMHCSDYDSYLTPGSFVPPSFPSHSQIIYCESNMTNVQWQQVFISFIPNENYNMIWIIPKQNPTSLFGQFTTGSLLFAYPELINAQNFSAGPIRNPNTGTCNVTIGPNQSNCTVANSILKWYGPDGQIISAPTNQQIQIDASTAFGTWTLKMEVPGAITSTSCGQTSIIQSTVNVPQCFACPTITPAGPIDIHGIYDGVYHYTLTSSSSTGNQWYKNGVAIPGATNQTYTVQVSGSSSLSDKYKVATSCYSNEVTINWISYMSTADFPVPFPSSRICSSSSRIITSQQIDLGPGSIYTWIVSPGTTCGSLMNYNPSSNICQINMSNCTQSSNSPYISSEFFYYYLKAKNGDHEVYMDAPGIYMDWSCRIGNADTVGHKKPNPIILKIFPNPATSQTTVTSALPIESVEIANMFNPSVLKKMGNGTKSITLYLGGLKPGVYSCKVTTKLGVLTQKLLIK